MVMSMGGDREVVIVEVRGEDMVSPVLNRVQRELRETSTQANMVGQQTAAGMGKARGGINNLLGGATLLKATIGGYIASEGVQLLAQLYETGDAANRADAIFEQLSSGVGGYEESLTGLRRVTQGIVTDLDLQQGANRILGMGLVESQADLERFIRLGSQLGTAFGVDAADGIENFALAVANMSYARLDTFGISAGRARQRVKELKEEGLDAQAAFTQAALEGGEIAFNRLGDAADAAVTPVRKLTTALQNNSRAVAGQFNQALNDSLQFLFNLGHGVELLTGQAGFFTAMTSDSKDAAAGVKVLEGALEGAGNEADSFTGRIVTMGEALDGFKATYESLLGLQSERGIHTLAGNLLDAAGIEGEQRAALEGALGMATGTENVLADFVNAPEFAQQFAALSPEQFGAAALSLEGYLASGQAARLSPQEILAGLQENMDSILAGEEVLAEGFDENAVFEALGGAVKDNTGATKENTDALKAFSEPFGKESSASVGFANMPGQGAGNLPATPATATPQSIASSVPEPLGLLLEAIPVVGSALGAAWRSGRRDRPEDAATDWGAQAWGDAAAGGIDEQMASVTETYANLNTRADEYSDTQDTILDTTIKVERSLDNQKTRVGEIGAAGAGIARSWSGVDAALQSWEDRSQRIKQNLEDAADAAGRIGGGGLNLNY